MASNLEISPIEKDFVQRRVLAGGWKLNVSTFGSGPDVLFLPGLGASWQWWLPSIASLGTGYRFHAVDLPGTGLSSGLGRFPTPERVATATRELLEQLDVQDATAVGHSLGGYLILQHILQGGDRIRRAMVIAPGGVVPMRSNKLSVLILGLIATLPFMKGVYGKLLLKAYSYWFPITEDVVKLVRYDANRTSNRISLAYQLLRSTKLTLLPNLPQLNVPNDLKERIHIIWGMRESVFPVECAEWLSRFLGEVPYTLYEKSDHWPQLNETERFQAELRNFLNG